MLWKVFVYLMPLLGVAGGDHNVDHVAASQEVNRLISTAAEEVRRSETEAWEIALKEELVDSPVYAGRLIEAIETASDETGLDPAMLWSVAYTETHGRHNRANGTVKRGGAREIGIMQVQPFWQRALKREYGIEVDLFDMADNVRAGAYILRRGGEEAKVMLSYYNTGQRITNSRYQRKVMRYWESFTEISENPVLASKPLTKAGSKAAKASASVTGSGPGKAVSEAPAKVTHMNRSFKPE